MMHKLRLSILMGSSLKVIKYESLSIALKVILNGVALSGSYRTKHLDVLGFPCRTD